MFNVMMIELVCYDFTFLLQINWKTYCLRYWFQTYTITQSNPAGGSSLYKASVIASQDKHVCGQRRLAQKRTDQSRETINCKVC